MEHITKNNFVTIIGDTFLRYGAQEKCKKFVSWSWEMLGSFLIMVGSPISVINVDEQQCECQENEKKEFTLVLDLDETLIHSDTERTSPIDEEISVKIGKQIEKYYVKLRPYVKEFLRIMSQFFELVVFTAGIKEYADKIIDFVDPCGFISRRFYRDSCTKKDGVFYKDLTKVNQNLEKTLIIDNSLSGMSMNPLNGILIKSWYNDEKDQELKIFEAMLKKNIKQNSNVRQSIINMRRKYPKNVLN